MAEKILYKTLTYSTAAVWFVNGLLCKLLNLVPRHEEIVSRILGIGHATLFTKLIGLSEIVMALWIISRIKSRLNAIAQILIIATMNTMEFILVPDLLLWGKFNSVFAGIFITIIFFNEFILNKKLIRHY
jgi:putative exporter of polyketide antibiotics